MKKLITSLGIAMVASFALGQVNVWNPAANEIFPPDKANWADAANWTGGVLPVGKAVFNVADAATCVLDSTQTLANELTLGDVGPGTPSGNHLIITNGANLTVNSWAATSYDDSGTITVYDGAVVNFNVHLFIGTVANGAGSGFTSEFIMKGGTVNILDGLITGVYYGTTGGVYGQETLHIQLDGGTVTCGRMELDWGTCDITDGTLITRRYDRDYLQQFINNGHLTAFGGAGTVLMSFDPNVGEFGQTTVTAINIPNTGYNLWAAGYGLAVGSETDDNDGDLLDNIHEYGAGGDPTNSLDRGIESVFTNAEGSMEFLYAQRSDDANLTYYLKTTADLIAPSWTNTGYSVAGTNVMGGTFDMVTNSIPTAENQTFIKLIVEYP